MNVLTMHMLSYSVRVDVESGQGAPNRVCMLCSHFPPYILSYLVFTEVLVTYRELLAPGSTQTREYPIRISPPPPPPLPKTTMQHLFLTLQANSLHSSPSQQGP